VPESPKDGSLLLRLGGIVEKTLPKLLDIISLTDELSASLGFDKLAEQVDWSLDDLVLLGKDLNLEDDLL
jgi:hypothetical protein